MALPNGLYRVEDKSPQAYANSAKYVFANSISAAVKKAEAHTRELGDPVTKLEAGFLCYTDDILEIAGE